jgi:hypothetical protein
LAVITRKAQSTALPLNSSVILIGPTSNEKPRSKSPDCERLSESAPVDGWLSFSASFVRIRAAVNTDQRTWKICWRLRWLADESALQNGEPIEDRARFGRPNRAIHPPSGVAFLGCMDYRGSPTISSAAIFAAALSKRCIESPVLTE